MTQISILRSLFLAALLPFAALPQTAPANPALGVRAFSAGGVVSFLGLTLIERNDWAQGTNKFSTNPRGYRFGGGAIAQFAFRDRYAIAGSFLLRRAKFESNQELTVTSGTIKQNEISSADFWELPIVFRRYSERHADRGSRWYAEGGFALRLTRNIRNSVQTTDTASKTTCCDENPIPAQNGTATGVTFGAGLQLIDEFGLRLVPNVRYTRWLQPAFDRLSIRSQPNQLEAGFAITF